MKDPTVAAIEARNAEHERLCSEVVRLTKAADEMFTKGYDQAVREIWKHFKTTGQADVAAAIAAVWMKEGPA